MNKAKIQILDQDGFVLKEFPGNHIEAAYQYAEQMEAMDIEVQIKFPSLPSTLAESLGAKREELIQLEKELQDEIDDHIPQSNCAPCRQ